MSIQRILTFLEVAESGSIIKAAKKLNLTQSAASTRIKLLEDDLRQPLFVRSASGMRLSPAGERFRPYALRMARAWQQGRQNMSQREDVKGSLSVAIQLTSWARLSHDWIGWMHANAPNYLLRVESDWSRGMIRNLADGYFDVIVTSVPTMVPGYVIEPYISEKLILVATTPDLAFANLNKGYVHVDWGPQFNEKFNLAVVMPVTPTVTVGLSDLALQIILREGGSAYLSEHAVQEQIDRQELFVVADAPEMTVQHYLMYPKVHHNSEGIRLAVEAFRVVAERQAETVMV